jgi:hypothetical protein
MLYPARQPSAQHHLLRSGPGKGPTISQEVTMMADVTHLTARLAEIEQEQLAQFRRIREAQQELDAIRRLLCKLIARPRKR